MRSIASRPGPWYAPRRTRPSSPTRLICTSLLANSCSQLARILSNTGFVSAIELLIALRISPAACCCSSASLVSLNRRTFSIAITNVRLFNETKEALEQQQAAGEILSAISSSIADTKPVFERILASCEQLFASKLVQINLVGDDGLVRLGAYHGPGRETIERIYPFPVDEKSSTGVAILHRAVGHYPDVDGDPAVPERARKSW